MAAEFQLTIKKDLKPSAIPSEDVFLSQARELMNSSETWKKGKSYHKDLVHTFHRPKGPGDGAAWHCRVSQHTAEDATFDEFWNMLGKNHSDNEIKYIKEVKKATLLKQISPSQSIWSMYYEFPPPVSPRFFTVLQIAHLDETSPKTGIFVSIPVDVSEDPEMAKQEFHHATRGRYCSVERIKEMGDGKVEWRMATSSTPGGHIPTFLVESTMASTISADVTHFLHWYHTVRPKADVAPSNAKETPAGQADHGTAISTTAETNAVDADIVSASTTANIPVAGLMTTSVPTAAGTAA
ncbi:hypothetical protein DENSPDRAFT_837163 [Dentipellis sp. KUC8613]|nr:hypothetical protein DENSPDRAFT_837163 [Dentipellis sp. KUC8613]